MYGLYWLIRTSPFFLCNFTKPDKSVNEILVDFHLAFDLMKSCARHLKCNTC